MHAPPVAPQPPTPPKTVPAPKSAYVKPAKPKVGNPAWFVPVMVSLMVVGLLWVVVYYISSQQYPIEALGRWNLGVGFGLMLGGFGMATRWR